jgi:uncharacterized membrane protein YoaK (UPF0700 family)
MQRASGCAVEAPATKPPPSLKFLTAVLSLTAGSLDVITFLGLSGLFAAHITGNLVVLAAHISAGVPVQPAALLSVPVFMLILGATKILASGVEAIGYGTLRPLLLVQFLFLAAFLVLVITERLATDTTGTVAAIGGMLAVSAMAVQNALVQISLNGAPSTAVMTTNIVRFTLDIATMLLRVDDTGHAKARERAGKTWPSIIGFIVGCMLGAVCEVRFGLRSLFLPTAFAALALVTTTAGHSKCYHEYKQRAADEQAERLQT